MSRPKIPKILMAELCAKVDTLGAVEHVAECYDLWLEAILGVPDMGPKYSRLIFSDGAGARGSILFCEGQRKAARRAARGEA